VWIVAPPAPGEECRVVVRLRGRDEETVRFDFWLLAPDGRVALAVEDYRARPLATLDTAPRIEGGTLPATAPDRRVLPT
jgi:hypothetical protein